MFSTATICSQSPMTTSQVLSAFVGFITKTELSHEKQNLFASIRVCQLRAQNSVSRSKCSTTIRRKRPSPCRLKYKSAPVLFVQTKRLLDILAGRKDPRGLRGTVLIDGAPQPPNFKCMSGYVSQVASSFPNLINGVPSGNAMGHPDEWTFSFRSPK